MIVWELEQEGGAGWSNVRGYKMGGKTISDATLYTVWKATVNIEQTHNDGLRANCLKRLFMRYWIIYLYIFEISEFTFVLWARFHTKLYKDSFCLYESIYIQFFFIEIPFKIWTKTLLMWSFHFSPHVKNYYLTTYLRGSKLTLNCMFRLVNITKTEIISGIRRKGPLRV